MTFNTSRATHVLASHMVSDKDRVINRNSPDIGFVACIERGRLEAQALLLFESIRRYAGDFREASIYALSPRGGPEISRAARRRLDELNVTFIDARLNTQCTEYGSANRVAAAAHIEATTKHEILAILDSDTLFLRQPTEIKIADDIDAAVRPVDVKGMSTTGPEDPFDDYWQKLAQSSGVSYESIPWCESFVDRRRIKANYNGGLVVVRRAVGIMSRWAAFFFGSVTRGIYPRPNGRTFRSGAGWVTPVAARLWGSNQAALALAIWNSSQRVRELPPTYNYPLHQHDKIDRQRTAEVFPNLVHVHYHWLLERDALNSNPLFQPDSPMSEEQRDWLRAATPIE
jgi:hypothetical protein